ncbi:MAG: RNA polymerase sigma factor [Acidobacteria bacterium]|nr:MAG: RNA polymerase sigma factor [Acidobacteriota bacterium]
MATTRVRHPPRDFGELVDIHQTEILRYLRRLTGNPTTAEDRFQDTFLRAFGGFTRLRPGSNHRAWLYRIATNLFLNHRRSDGCRVEVALTPELPSNGASPSTVHDGAVALAALRLAIGRLPRRQRAAFIQRQLHGLSYREVGAAIGCSDAATRANVYQAVRRLRRELSSPW